MPDGNYTVHVRAPGYTLKQVPVTLPPGGVVSITVALNVQGPIDPGPDPDPEQPACCQRPNGKALPDPSELLVGALSLLILMTQRRRTP